MRALLALPILLALLVPPSSALVPWPTCIPGTEWSIYAEGAPGSGAEILCKTGPLPWVMGSCVVADGETSCAASGTYDGPPGHVSCRPRGGAAAYSCEASWQVGVP